MPLPSVGEVLRAHLERQRAERRHGKSLLDGQPHSWASSAMACSRQMGFSVAEIPMSDPPGPDALFNFGIGDYCHDVVQTSILASGLECGCCGCLPELHDALGCQYHIECAGFVQLSPYREARAEVSGDIGDFLTYRADGTYLADDDGKVILEIKSVSEFAFEAAVLGPLRYVCRHCGRESSEHTSADNHEYEGASRRQRQQPQGPKIEHIVQGAICAVGEVAPYLAVVYVMKTATKDKPIIHEWRYRVEDYLPQTRDELDRAKFVVGQVKQGLLPDPFHHEWPDEPPDPSKDKWPCNYCSWQTLCMTLPKKGALLPHD